MAFIKEVPEGGTGQTEPLRLPKRVLVVDDDPNILRLIPDALEPDFVCSCVSSSEQAQEFLLADQQFDLIISDVRMSGMSGIEFVGYIKSNYSRIPIIVMSGATEIEIAVAAMRARAADYLVKPFNLSDLSDSVTRAIANASSGEESLREHEWNAAARALAEALGAKDDETDGHAVRVVHYSLRLGREMNLSRGQMLALKLGSRLHDIGKIGVPEQVLRKPAKLDDDEWEKMRRHPSIGQQMVINVGLPEAAARVVGQHHEWWNGKGYPAGLAGDEIDITTRIFSVVDAYDAMTSDRVYRKGRPHDDALAELRRCAGEQFDPQVVEAFARVQSKEWTTICLGCVSEDHRLATTAVNF